MVMIAKSSDVESQKSQIHETWKGVQWLEKGLGSFDKDVVEDCMHALIDLTKKIHHFGAPKPINEVGT